MLICSNVLSIIVLFALVSDSIPVNIATHSNNNGKDKDMKLHHYSAELVHPNGNTFYRALGPLSLDEVRKAERGLPNIIASENTDVTFVRVRRDPCTHGNAVVSDGAVVHGYAPLHGILRDSDIPVINKLEE